MSATPQAHTDPHTEISTCRKPIIRRLSTYLPSGDGRRADVQSKGRVEQGRGGAGQGGAGQGGAGQGGAGQGGEPGSRPLTDCALLAESGSDGRKVAFVSILMLRMVDITLFHIRPHTSLHTACYLGVLYIYVLYALHFAAPSPAAIAAIAAAAATA